MASRQARGNGGFSQATAPRTNEYFIPRDGIDREVITADICRYLGNDALVRPGTYTDNTTGQATQGYFITAYRNLTTAMIDDLKEDSARWEAERRRQSGTPGRYQDSHIRDGPQRGMAAGANYGAPAPAGYNAAPPREYDNAPRYPGNQTPGYSGAVPGAAPGPAPYSGPGMGSYGGGYSQGQPPAAPYQHPGIQDSRFQGQPAPAGMGYGANNPVMAPGQGQQHAPFVSGANFQVHQPRPDYSMDMAMDEPMAPTRRTSPPGAGGFGPNPPANMRGYQPGPGGGNGSYVGYQPPPPSGPGMTYAQPIDNGYGRAPTMPNPGFNPGPHDMQTTQAQQYEDPAYPPSPSRSGPAAPNTQTQLPSPSGSAAGNRRDRERTVSERADYRDRERDLHREPTPPNRTGSANKNAGSGPYGARR